ncbi:17513_t:CDS:2 [Rhizophagus irregularis]|nr:17513_t:CDS:2 [Rhizophagus irregularis]
MNVKKPIKLDSLPTSTTSKGRHASHLFNKSSMRTTKHIFSKRQGTSYDVNYNHYTQKLIERTDTRTMYYKQLSNFRHTTPIKSTVFSKQHERFERHCRKTFNQNKSHNIQLDDPSSQKVNPSSPLVKHKGRYIPHPSTYYHDEPSTTPNNRRDYKTIGMLNKYSQCFSDADISSIASYDLAQTHQSNMSLETPVPSPPAVAGPSNYNHSPPILPLPN